MTTDTAVETVMGMQAAMRVTVGAATMEPFSPSRLSDCP
jgi:hypothetical protein